MPQTDINKDLYALLGVSPTASMDEIKKAFRIKAAEFHPDRNTSELAPVKFREIREAYEVLGDPEARAAYDENRHRNLLEAPMETARDIWTAYLSGVMQ
jgi:DnaJ-class molecular chaperone